MSLTNLILGRPLASSEERAQRIPPAQGIPIFGLDALSSAAYGPEAALTVLIPLGLVGLGLVLPLSLAIILLLAVLYLSYRQTIAAYPKGAGSYTVAKENLGERAGLLAAAALMMDYLLNVAVGISAGVGALVSAVPVLQPQTLPLCLLVLAALTVVNLRGTREPGLLFLIPTYLFIGCLLGTIGWGVVRSVFAHGHPQPLVPTPQPSAGHVALGVWLVLRAFASGCTAMTGVEAVSNGVQAFREPVVPAARRTLSVIVAVLIVMLAGIAYLARVYRIGATLPGVVGYQSVLSQLTTAVAGRGFFYYLTMSAVIIVLCLSANTSFADFPRLCRVVAVDGYLPRSLASRGRRLVYAQGIGVLAGLAGALLILFGGVTDRLIPLFAVGAFAAFTLSQSGMVVHWLKAGGRTAIASMAMNAIGASATGVTTAIVLAAKFAEGAWVIALLAPAMLAIMAAVHAHYERVARETRPMEPFRPGQLPPPLVVVPVESWSTVTQKALRFALTMSSEVQILHVESEDAEPGLVNWQSEVAAPLRAAGLAVPEVVVLKSPYRFVIHPILDYILEFERRHKGRMIAVVIPELVERHWYHYFLHNQRGHLLAALLLVRGERRVAVVSVPWHLKD